jgi:actin-related protein 10
VHRIYFRHLLVNPKDRRVVLVDALLGPIRFKEVLSRVLFKHFEVLSILYSPSHLMPLLTLGIQTALVLDVGYAEATLIPVYEGVPVLKAWQAQPMASGAVHGAIRDMLQERGMVKTGGGGETRQLSAVEPKIDIPEDVVEDIKGRCLDDQGRDSPIVKHYS